MCSYVKMSVMFFQMSEHETASHPGARCYHMTKDNSPAQTFDPRRAPGQTLQPEAFHWVITLLQLTLGLLHHLSVMSGRPSHSESHC